MGTADDIYISHMCMLHVWLFKIDIYSDLQFIVREAHDKKIPHMNCYQYVTFDLWDS